MYHEYETAVEEHQVPDHLRSVWSEYWDPTHSTQGSGYVDVLVIAHAYSPEGEVLYGPRCCPASPASCEIEKVLVDKGPRMGHEIPLALWEFLADGWDEAILDEVDWDDVGDPVY